MWAVETKTEDIVAGILSDPQPYVPAHVTHIGASEVRWWEGRPGDAVVMAAGGSAEDRYLAEQIVTAQLEAVGYKRAQFTFDANHKTAGWADIMTKAKRLIQSGAVTILRNGYNTIVGHIEGDHGEYTTEIGREDPESRSISTWQCECNSPDNLIVMADGSLKTAKDIQTGDFVLTATGHAGIVGRTMSREYDGRMMGLTIEGSTETSWFTDNHKLITAGIEAKEAGEWKSGDFSYLPRPQYVEQTEIDVAQILPNFVEHDGRLYKLNKTFGSKRVRKVSRIATAISPRQKSIPAKIALDENFARLGGLYVAEGIATPRGELRWSFSPEEGHLADEVIERLKVYGLDNAKKKLARSCLTVAIQSKPMSEVFKALFGTGSRIKKLAMPIMAMNQESLRIFFNAWVEGDGHWQEQRNRFYLGTASDVLAMQARLILVRLEKESTLRRIDKNVSPLVPNGGSFNQLTWRGETRQIDKRNSKWFENDQVTQRMVVSEKHYRGTVYNFEVLDEHSYVLSPGIASLNCPWDQYAWQRCVKIGTMITQADGRQIPVEDIAVGDTVIDHKGEIGIVADTHLEDWDQEVITFRTTGFEDLTVKPDHPVLVVPSEQVCCRNQNGQRAKFGKGRKGDFCALNTCGCRNSRTKKVEPLFKKAEDIDSGDFLVRPTLQTVIEQESLDLQDYASDQTVVENDMLVPTREFTTRWGTMTVAKQKKSSLPLTVDVTPSLLRLFGYYLAEGTITDYSIRFTFHEKEIEYHQDVAALGKEIFGVTPRYEHGDNVTIISFNNRELATIFTNLLGRHVMKKCVPDWAMWLPTELQESLIDGWFRGDGHTRKSDGRKELTTVSPTLANQGELLLQRLGFTVGRIKELRSEHPRPNSKPNEKDAYKLYWLLRQGHSRGVRFRENGHTLVKITESLRHSYRDQLVDLTIMGNPGYLAEGFAVHNTRKWKKYDGRPCSHVMALYWKSLATPLDDYDPEQHGPMGTGQKTGPPPPPPAGGEAPPAPPSPVEAPPGGSPLPRSFGPQDAEGFSPPGPPDILPTPPMDQLAEQMPPIPGQTPAGMPANPSIVSVPGAKMPTPFNPIQYPGGTYSKTAAEEFVAPEIVQLKEDCYGMAEGKSDAHGNGQYQNVPAGSRGEVLGQDPSTGWVEVIFPLDESSYLEPYHVKCFVEPKDLMHTTQSPPGPFVQRRR